MGLSVINKSNHIIGLISLTFIVEIFGLICLGLFFTRSLTIFQNEVLWELKRRDDEKIIKDVNIEHELFDGKNLFFFVSQDNRFFDVEGIIFPRIYRKMASGINLLPIQSLRIPTLNRINSNSKVQLSEIPKEILNLMKVGDNLEFNVLLKLRNVTYDFFYINIYITFKKMDEENLKYIKEPYFQIINEEAYNSVREIRNNPYPIDFNLFR